MKKTILIVLSLCMLLSSSFTTGDITEAHSPLAPPNDWAIDGVQKAEKMGIISNDAPYRYSMSITREDFCTLIYNFAINVVKTPIPKYENNFTDTDLPEVNILHDMGIIKGKAEGKFAPLDFLTREEAATIIVRTVNTIMPVPVTEMYFTYDDRENISEWAMDSVQIISNMKIMEGTGDNKFCPKLSYTTEQAIVTLARLGDVYSANYANVEKSNFTDGLATQMPKDKNYMFSPLSIKMALALAANGADGKTKDEILNASGISDIDEFNEMSKKLIERYSQTENLSLNIANSVWINSDKTSQSFSKDYKNKMQEFYLAEVKNVGNSNAVKEINSWVSKKTNGKIPSIINNSDFWASLINAIYFKAAWENEFWKSATVKDEFTSADGTRVKTDFMNKTGWMSAVVSKDLKALELPYKNRFDKVSDTGEYLGSESFDELDVSMYLIMTDDEISPEAKLCELISSSAFTNTYVRLGMPKFKIEFDLELNDALKNLGINTAFEPEKADFKNMFDSGNMWITDTIHKTYISVDEEGTEAAAVTAIHMAGTSLPPEPVEMKFNKPFYFIIRDNTSGESLFVGRYAFVS